MLALGRGRATFPVLMTVSAALLGFDGRTRVLAT
jgi:hypothetical protein